MQFNAKDAFIAYSNAFSFKTGKLPGSARHTGHTLVFCSDPKSTLQEQKHFIFVAICTWVSRPITTLNSIFTSTKKVLDNYIII